MRRFLVSLLAVATLASCADLSGHVFETTRYNLDFESRVHNTAKPLRWYVMASGYEVSADTTVSREGRTSLRIERRDTAARMAFLNQVIPVDAAGREVCLTGWVRTENVDSGLAAIWIGGHDNADWDIESPETQSVKGTCDWTQLTVRGHLSDSAQLLVALAVMGGGRAWFDDFRITIDGQPLVDSIVSAPKSTLTRAEKRALRQYIYPLRTWEPDNAGTEDLQILRQLIGDASVVALGEGSHGSREIFRMKDRLIRHLAEEDDFDIFSIEANMPESYAVGRYVAGGEGNAPSVIRRMYFWTWSTDSMRDLVEWMRAHNAAGYPMAYTGFDMQFSYGSEAILRQAFAGDRATQQLLDKLSALFAGMAQNRQYGVFAITSEQLRAAEEQLSQLTVRIDALPDATIKACRVPAGGDGRAWLHQQIAVLRQFIHTTGPADRDRSMADNLLWIKDQNPGSRIVAWAHNGHVNRRAGAMGGYLAERLGSDYVTFGFTFYDGAYTALGDRGLTAYDAQTAYPGTVEYLLGQLDEPLFILDLKRMRAADDPALAWIDALGVRSVGSMAMEQEFFTDGRLSEDFDYLIFIRHTTPSRLLPQTAKQ